MNTTIGFSKRPIIYALSGISLCTALGFYLAQGVDVANAESATTERSLPADEKSAGSTDQKVPTITVATVEQKQITETVPVLGSLAAREIVFVNPEISGYKIESVAVDIGDVVNKGDLLASLNTDVLVNQQNQVAASKGQVQASVAQAKTRVSAAKAAVAQAQLEYSRFATLRKKGHVTQAALDQASAQLTTAKADLNSAIAGVTAAEAQVREVNTRVNQATLDVKRSHITAPENGVIASRNANVGNIANIGAEPMFRIIKDGEIEAVVEITESALAKVGIGDVAHLQVTGVGETQGALRLIGPRVDAQTRLANVHISLPENTAWREGLSVSGNIAFNSRAGVAVGTRSVLADVDGGNYVFVVNDGRVEKRTVETGVISGGLREIKSGLSEGEVIVQNAGVFLQDGDQIRELNLEDRTALVTAAEVAVSGLAEKRESKVQ